MMGDEINSLKITDEQLLSMAKSFEIDPYMRVEIKCTGYRKKWVICCNLDALNKTKEWSYIPRSSGQTDDYRNSVEFDSANEAAEFYLNWRNAQCFIYAVSGEHKGYVTWGSDIDKTENVWNNWIRTKVQGHGYLVGPGRKVIREFHGKDDIEAQFAEFP